LDLSNKLLSTKTSFRTYAKFQPHLGRRETLEEIINRNMLMHLDRFPKLSKDIVKAYQRVHDLKAMPSMRALQFSGEAVLKNNARQYNCSFAHIKDVEIFSEIMFLLLSGVGVGYSVQKRHTSQLPKVTSPREEGKYIIHDSIIGWAEAVNVLFEAYFYGRIRPQFDYSSIRPKGSYLVTTGAKAPGPEPLRKALEEVEQRLKLSIGRQLMPIEIHDIICILSDAVLAGGIRRAALISLFDRNDTEMLKAKSGEWWLKHPYRARANNSAVLPLQEVTKEEFIHIFNTCKNSGAGEPGFSWSNNIDMGYNPCVTGDTEILTDNGYKRIDSIVDEEVTIWNGFEWSKVTPKVTGENQELVTITFNDGRSLTCTKYHTFHIAMGYSGDSREVKAKELEVGMKLIKHEFPIIETGIEVKDDYAYTQGFISAEGMDGYNFLWLYKPKETSIKRLAGNVGKYNEKEERYIFNLKYNHELKSMVPFEWNLKGKLNWLAGLFDGDGCELKEGGLQLGSVDRKFLTNLQSLLSTIGVQCKIVPGMKAGMRTLPNGNKGYKDFYCQDSYRLCIGAVQMQQLKKLGLTCERLKFDKTPQRDASQYITVVDITESGIADKVYCFNEPKRHLGIFNGIITGQCHEIALNSNQFCNLSTINMTGIKDKRDYLNRVYTAALIGTLQASYTDFPYLRPIWKQTTDLEALLGVSCTGIADAGNIDVEWLEEGAQLVLDVNEKYAKKIGINLAARTTAIKPEGTSSCVLGSSSGVHARHSAYYLRRIRMNKSDALSQYLSKVIPELVEEDVTSSTGIVVTVPQKSPDGAILRENETAFDLLDRVILFNKHWIVPGHRTGDNKHNVSATISVKDNEWDKLGESLWKNRKNYTGISLLPYDGGNYKQAPFEACSKETYEKYMLLVKDVDLKEVKEEEDNTQRVEQLACAGGLCEL
jgi:ribonucleotide reductase alpha subunit